MKNILAGIMLSLVTTTAVRPAAAENGPIVVTEKMHHLRQGDIPEWSDFPLRAEGRRLELKFASEQNPQEFSLQFRQQDVKETWRIRLNSADLGRLIVDENDMIVCFPIPLGALRDGENTLAVEQVGDKPKADDIRVGDIRIFPTSRAQWLGQASVKVAVRDSRTGQSLPSRITVLTADGALQTVHATSSQTLAVRPGIIYTSTGEAEFRLPPGRYTLYSGRGFEYSVDLAEIDVVPGRNIERALKIQREVSTEGYVACDPHVHTLTYSGHGDATLAERMITLAGEGVELPVATDHNRHVDYEAVAAELGVRRYFTPLMGNEVTTSVGHFNVFPVRLDAEPADHRAGNWSDIFANIQRSPDTKVIILNHARDLHAGVRPFGPRLHNAAAGANIAGWKLQANAMEVVNSGSIQSDSLQLIRDWMAALNHGHLLTPVGASDSHDVGRHFVGQARTYIRARDNDPSAIHVAETLANFQAGQVLVSYGLLAELVVDGKFEAGETAPAPNDSIAVKIRVLGPSWCRANKVMLFANGALIREQELDEHQRTNELGVIAVVDWEIPRTPFDVHLVAVAVGPGISKLYWPTAKPYQPMSADFTPKTIACSGAVWCDGDRNGRKTPACDYAAVLVAACRGDFDALLQGLRDYDTAVAIQAAHLWQTATPTLLEPPMVEKLRSAAPHVRDGFARYLEAWRENQRSKEN